MQKRLIIILFISFLFLPEKVVPSSINKVFGSNSSLSKGVFLVASPNLMGPYFTESVVLIAEYSHKGALGVIINRPSGVDLSEAIPDVEWLNKKSDSLFIGGPVSRFLPFTLLSINRKLQNTNHIFNNVYFSQNITVIRKIITNKDPKDRIRVYAGYSGWASGQLEKEIARGSWRVVTADQFTIFEKDPRTIWEDLIKGNSQLIVNKPNKSTYRLKS